MVQRKKQTTKKTVAKKAAVKHARANASWFSKAVHEPSTVDDVKTAALLVSVTINAAVLVGWLAVQITNKYDAQVASLLFN